MKKNENEENEENSQPYHKKTEVTEVITTTAPWRTGTNVSQKPSVSDPVQLKLVSPLNRSPIGVEVTVTKKYRYS